MAVFRSTDWTRKSGDILAAAQRGPVTITRHKRPAFVVMSYDRYERLNKRDTRRSVTIDETTAEDIMMAEAALARFEAEPDV